MSRCAECAGRLMIGGGTRGGPILLRGKGSRVWDTQGKSYIDCTAQSWALYLGYCNDEIWEAINQQAPTSDARAPGLRHAPPLLPGQASDRHCPRADQPGIVLSLSLALEGGMKIALKTAPAPLNS